MPRPRSSATNGASRVSPPLSLRGLRPCCVYSVLRRCVPCRFALHDQGTPPNQPMRMTCPPQRADTFFLKHPSIRWTSMEVGPRSDALVHRHDGSDRAFHRGRRHGLPTGSAATIPWLADMFLSKADTQPAAIPATSSRTSRSQRPLISFGPHSRQRVPDGPGCPPRLPYGFRIEVDLSGGNGPGKRLWWWANGTWTASHHVQPGPRLQLSAGGGAATRARGRLPHARPTARPVAGGQGESAVRLHR